MGETPEELLAITQYLKSSRTAWITPFTGEPNIPLPLVMSPFFYGVRANYSQRLYMWGQVRLLAGLSAASEDSRGQYLFDGYPGLLAPNTEEFLERGAVHNPLANVGSISAMYEGLERSGRFVVLACDLEGRLYVQGYERDNAVVGGNTVYNRLGLGAANTESDTGLAPPNVNATRGRQVFLQRVYGDNESFGTVRFVKVLATLSVSIALDENGQLWFAGDSRGIAAGSFPDDPDATTFTNPDGSVSIISSRVFTQFRRQASPSWRNVLGAIQTGSLNFVDFWANSEGTRLMAQTNDGRLFAVGSSFRGRGQIQSVQGTMSQIASGFVDAVVSTPGSDGVVPTFSGTPSVLFSAPPAGGVRATGTAIMQSVPGTGRFIVLGIRIINPGSGYTSPPTVTVGTGASARTDIVSCTVFSGTWKTAHMNEGSYAAISNEGVMYLWGLFAYEPAQANEELGTFFFGTVVTRDFNSPVRAVQFQALGRDAPQQPDEYETVKVCPSSFGGVALGVTGRLTYWGPADRTPDNVGKEDLTLWGEEDLEVEAGWRPTYIDCDISGGNVFALVDSENDVYTYGRRTSGLGHGKDMTIDSDLITYRPIAKVVGNAKWARVFAIRGASGFYAVRLPEELGDFNLRKNPLPPWQDPPST